MVALKVVLSYLLFKQVQKVNGICIIYRRDTVDEISLTCERYFDELVMMCVGSKSHNVIWIDGSFGINLFTSITID